MERELAFLKRHAFLLAGVGLPLLLVLTLVVARALPRFLVEDPRYEVVYLVHGTHYDANDRRTLSVTPEDGGLVARWALAEHATYLMRPRVYRVDVAGDRVVELLVPEPDDLEALGGEQVLPIEGLEDVRLDPRALAPDGYAFSSRYGGGGGLFGELFYGGSRGLRVRLEKDGRRVDVPQLAEQGSVRFLGWAVPLEEAE